MRVLNCLILVTITWTWLPATTEAQMVQVGPGYVRAPFVRVYRDPGGVYVRAPFVSRYSPAFPRPGFRQDFRGAAAAQEDFAQLSWRDLSRRIRESCVRLDRQLEQLPSAEFWRSSLKTDEILGLVPVDSDGPPDDQTRGSLTDLLATYDSIGATPDFNRVAQLNSFQTLRAALTEYVMLPEPRMRHQLSLASAQLYRSLGRFKTGSHWRNYLEVAPGKTLSEDRLRASDEVSTSELAEALAHFDVATQSDEYAFIAKVPAFKTMHTRLASYFGERQVPSSTAAEELPSPKPVSQ